MSSYSPPIEDVAIFDSINFSSGDEFITQSQADKRYLRFPNAQGTENLQAINVGGLATFNADIVQSNSESNNIVQQNITTDGNQNILRTTDMFGTLRLKRPTSANGGDLLLYDVTGSSGDFTQFYLAGSAFAFKNLAKGGKIGITLQDNNNVELDPLTLTQSSNQARVGINNTNPACTLDVRGITNITSVSSSLGTNTFAINDTGSSGGTKGMLFYPNATAGTFNPLQQNGDNWIVATTGLGIDTANLTINTWATERNGMRITPLTTSIYGGNNDYIKVDGSIDTTETVGTNLSIQNTNVSLTSSIPPTSSATQPAPTDSSTKIPTTAWVQTAVSRLLTLNNTWTGTNFFTNTAVGSLTSSATQPASSDSSTKIPTTAWVQSAISALPNLLTSNNTWTGTQNWTNTAVGSLTSSATQPASSDSSTKIPTTAWVQSAISASPPPSQFVPRFVNYTNIQTGSTGYSSGPLLTFNGTWNINDIAYFRITSQVSYNLSGGAYQNTGNTMGVIYFRPYYFTSNWAPVSTSGGGTLQIYTNNSGQGRAYASAYYYLPSFNIGATTNFYLNNGSGPSVSPPTSGAVRISCLAPGSGWTFFVSVEYLGASVTSGGTVTISDGNTGSGSQTNNSLP